MLSVVVNFFNNRREARNTLRSLTRHYQRGSGNIPYEVIAIDHGSSKPLQAADVRGLGPEFSYHYVSTTCPSPVAAINAACRDAQGERLLVIIDGAHILSPGILALTDAAFRLFAASFVATVPFHLGPKVQNESILEGYNQDVEDALLARIGWQDDGYRLYEAAGAYSDGSMGWFGCLFESGCFGIRKTDYLSMGGFDERFQSPGGGLVSLDFFQRAVSRRDLQYMVLLGEGTFHQFHGGVASNAPPAKHPWNQFHEEYVRIRGKPFGRVLRPPFFLGSIPPVRAALSMASASAEAGSRFWQSHSRG